VLFDDDLMDMVLLTHGVSATLSGAPITVIPFDGYAQVDDIQGTDPMVACATSALPEVVVGTFLVVSGRTYSVIDSEPDGLGSTILKLEYQSG
jgi:hypothetical protein